MEMVFASVYMPGDRAIPSETVRKLVGHCEGKEIPLVIGCDSNAHHTLWGSTNVNERGELLLEYLMGTQLEVANQGNMGRVEDWRVDPSASCSDHRYILFNIRVGQPDPIFYRNRHKADWATYALEANENLSRVPTSEIANTMEIEERVNRVTEILVTCFHNACPLKRVRPDCPNKRFWTPELTLLRREGVLEKLCCRH
jgi:hypothetical protein